MKKATSRSPIKEPLLRLPGQSIDEQMDRLFSERLLNYGLFAFEGLAGGVGPSQVLKVYGAIPKKKGPLLALEWPLEG